jgi:hypothetical protein
MAAPSATEFLARYPEFSEILSDVVEGAVAEAALSTSETLWGGQYTKAVLLLAAHLLAGRTMQIGAQVGSPTGNPTGTGLDATQYGQEYKRLLATLPLSGFAL